MISAFDWGRARLLYVEMRLLTQLRWLIGVGVLALGVMLRMTDTANAMRVIVLGGVILAANVIVLTTGTLRRAAIRRADRLRSVAVGLIVFDIACLGFLAAWTGGAQSPALLLLLPMVVLAAGVAGSQLHLVVLTLVALGSGGAAIAIEAPATPLQWASVSLWGLTLVAIAALSGRVQNALYEREVTRVVSDRRERCRQADLRRRESTFAHDENLVALGRMTAGIAHEIANPLAGMDSILQLMQRRPEQPRPDSVRLLREQVARILQIVRQLTRQAHPGVGAVETVSLDEVVRSSIDLLVLGRHSELVSAEYGLHDGSGTVRLNPQAMQQVISNLLVNALDATDGIDDPRIEVRTLREGAWCVVEVQDNGPGIKSQHLPHIFEPFYTTKPVGQGTGLGLSICARIVEEQQGQIDVLSGAADGAVFRVRFPAIDGEKRHDSRHDSGDGQRGDSSGVAEGRRAVLESQDETESLGDAQVRQRRSIGATQ